MSTFKLIIAILTLSSIGTAQAEVCRAKNYELPFRQVVLGLTGGLRCDYGPEFDFKHSYALDGKFAAGRGLWEGASDPYTIYCKGTNTSCVFYNKP